VTSPEDNFPFIDSLEREHLIPTSVADYFRANAYYPLQQYRAVEFYSKKALTDGDLYKAWPKAYYICSRNLANNLHTKGDYETALSFAMAAYEKAQDDPRPEAKLNAPGLLLFISMCQYALGKTTEAEQHCEQCYRMSFEQTKIDTSFNAHYHFALNTLSVLTSMGTNMSKEQAHHWIGRAEGAVELLQDISQRSDVKEFDKELAHTITAIFCNNKSIILANLGEMEAAEQAYKEFLQCSYSTKPNGFIARYNYLRAAKRWDEAIEIIPTVDSIKASRGHVLTFENLKAQHVKYDIYQHAGQREKAIETAVNLIESIDSVVKAQQKSEAAELAVVFETRQQERKIAEQQTVISRQRMLAAGIATLFSVAFLVFFLLHNRKATRKMQLEHNKLQKAYAKLAEVNEKAEVSSKMKSAFIKQISHEIRTPLNILSGFTQVITSDFEIDDATRKEARQHIVENTQRITGLVNRMLELSEASSQSAVENLSEESLSAIVRQAVDESQISHAAHVTFSNTISDELGHTVLLTHKRRAARALSLLLDNAAKFTPNGEVRLSASPTADQRSIALVVEDTGIGIPAKEAMHVFEEFVQLDEYKEGTGIGLTVARSFARRLGGDIVLDTTYTGGARFIMTLPINKTKTT
jgi:signal transduction histidine kinase